jgi:DNA-directed RNA polymerase specialized sigma24 family protein
LRQPPEPAGRGRSGPVAEFDRLYRAQVGVVTAFFARRSADPQTVADLTADTFVRAIISFGSFDPGKGTARAWTFGIARRVYAAHCETHSQRDLERCRARPADAWLTRARVNSALAAAHSRCQAEVR